MRSNIKCVLVSLLYKMWWSDECVHSKVRCRKGHH